MAVLLIIGSFSWSLITYLVVAVILNVFLNIYIYFPCFQQSFSWLCSFFFKSWGVVFSAFVMVAFATIVITNYIRNRRKNKKISLSMLLLSICNIISALTLTMFIGNFEVFFTLNIVEKALIFILGLISLASVIAVDVLSIKNLLMLKENNDKK